MLPIIHLLGVQEPLSVPCEYADRPYSPADIRYSTQVTACSTVEYTKKLKAAEKQGSGPPHKRRKTSRNSKSTQSASTIPEESFHFIGYVPVHGKVWELDGLRNAGPLEIGEFSSDDPHADWMNIVRPALKRRMQQLGTDNIRYNLLALVEDRYENASDELESLKRKKLALERRLNEECRGWLQKVPSFKPCHDLLIYQST